MYAYRYVDSAERKPVINEYSVLDKMIREYFDSTRNIKRFPEESIKASTYYMWSPGMPLMKYRERAFKKDTAVPELKKWASMGPFYKKYGIYIIKRYPWHFIKYFIWPNAGKYYAPPVEFLQIYNSGKDSVSQVAKTWFDYNSSKVWNRSKDPEVTILNFYPILSGIINVIMLFGLLFFSMLNGFNKYNNLRSAIILGGVLWLINAAFTITASSAALRFQSFPIIISTTFSLIVIDWIRIKAMEERASKDLSKENEPKVASIIPSIKV
jgi:hypothetical protein